jgi:hypothetical protein
MLVFAIVARGLTLDRQIWKKALSSPEHGSDAVPVSGHIKFKGEELLLRERLTSSLRGSPMVGLRSSKEAAMIKVFCLGLGLHSS